MRNGGRGGARSVHAGGRGGSFLSFSSYLTLLLANISQLDTRTNPHSLAAIRIHYISTFPPNFTTYILFPYFISSSQFS
ncbi:hypothetical protein C8R46DRAFT_1131799 [Mycena filopes]|nr:hypothetical protein C8R46DRAFT_1131799 [Mycena filopes]